MSKDAKAAIARDTVERSEAITAATPRTSPESTFISGQLPRLPSPSSISRTKTPIDQTSNELINPLHALSPLKVFTGDTLSTALSLTNRNPSYKGKVAILNMACDTEAAYGWNYRFGNTQEDSLCYSSTLFATLRLQQAKGVYPWSEKTAQGIAPGFAVGIYSPGVVVFKGPVSAGCNDLPTDARVVVSMTSVATPKNPPTEFDTRTGQQVIRSPQHLEILREKIRLIYRLAATNGKTVLVLGATGCGAFKCPPRQVAEEMKRILTEEEFCGWLKEIVWAIYDPQVAGIFREVMK